MTQPSCHADASVELIKGFAQAWERCDVDGVISRLAPAITYQNVPSPAINGRDAVRDFITPSLSAMTHMDWQFLTCISSPDGRSVAAERIDTFHFPEGQVRVAVMGSFELADGLIHKWRDYCDLGDFARQMTALGRPLRAELKLD